MVFTATYTLSMQVQCTFVLRFVLSKHTLLRKCLWILKTAMENDIILITQINDTIESSELQRVRDKSSLKTRFISDIPPFIILAHKCCPGRGSANWEPLFHQQRTNSQRSVRPSNTKHHVNHKLCPLRRGATAINCWCPAARRAQAIGWLQQSGACEVCW